MGWKRLATDVGIGALTAGVKALEGKVSRRQYKRLIATAVAELLALHPKLGPKQARRRAARAVGAKPTKLGRHASTAAVGLEAVLGAGAAEVVQHLGKRAKRKLEQRSERHSELPPVPQQA